MNNVLQKIEGFIKTHAVMLVICALLLSISVLMLNEGVRETWKDSLAREPYYGVKTEVSSVSIECNVYMGAEFLNHMLDTLKQKKVRITFFVGGIWAKDNEALVKRIVAEGHEIANHGYSHQQHSRISAQANRDEMMKTDALIQKLTGVKMQLFAPPSGDFNQLTLRIAEENNYKTIMWTADTIDWRDQNPELLLSRVKKKIDKGGIVLIHPTRATAQMLPCMIDELCSLGYDIVPVGELIKLQD